MYDSRLGKWFSTDPHAANYPSTSPYTFALNSPLMFKDADGKDVFYYDSNLRLIARLITVSQEHIHYIVNSIPKDVPNVPGIFPIVKDLRLLSMATDAIGFGVGDAAMAGGGYNAGLEMVIFTRGPQALQPVGYAYYGMTGYYQR